MTRARSGAERIPNALMAEWYSPVGAKGYTDFPLYSVG